MSMNDPDPEIRHQEVVDVVKRHAELIDSLLAMEGNERARHGELFELVAMLSERQSRIEALLEKVALGLGVAVT
jgi:hypothetical protein